MSTLPTIIITGASYGIGRSIAILLSSTNRFKLVLLARGESKLHETAKICESVNGVIQIMTLKCDISDDKRLEFCINKIAKEFGPISFLINNAAVFSADFINANTMNMANIDKTININLNATIKCSAFCVPFIKETKQKYKTMSCGIINIGSGSSTLRATKPTNAVYAASKWGLMGFTDCLYQELRNEAIKICVINPGFVNTPMVAHRTDLVHKNMVQPNDIAKAVLFAIDSDDTVCPLEMHLRPLRTPFKAKWEALQKKSKL